MKCCEFEFWKAVADPARQKIMEYCCCEARTVNELVRHVGLGQSTVSHHLSVLRRAGVLKAERRGKELLHSLNQKRVAMCCGRLMASFAPDQKNE